MFDGPIRGGTRGGQGEFKWADVSADKDRENYLGHSINAPTGRWQKNKDVHWYNRDLKTGEAERLEEIRKVKEAEEDALAVALGFKPAVRPAPGTEPEPGPSTVDEHEKTMKLEDPAILAAKEEKRRRKEERQKRKEEKRERKELKRARKLEYAGSRSEGRGVRREVDSDDEYDVPRRYTTRSRSRSPRRFNDRVRSRARSSPPSRTPSYDGGRRRPRLTDGRDQHTREDRRRVEERLDRPVDRSRW